MGRQGNKPRGPQGKSHAEMALRSHYGLARKAGNAYNKNPTPRMKAAVEGIMESAKKHLRAINAERAKAYKKPLTLNELIEFIRESE